MAAALLCKQLILPTTHLVRSPISTKQIINFQGLKNLQVRTQEVRTFCMQCWHSLKWRAAPGPRFSVKREFHQSNATRAQTKRSKAPFEVDPNVRSDTLIFSYSNARFYKMMTTFGIVQFFFWGNLAMFTYSGLGRLSEEGVQQKLEENSNPFLGLLLKFQSKYSSKMAVMCVIVGYMVMFFTWLYPQRSIHKLKLLAGGRNLNITTYSHFGSTRAFQVPLEQVSCQHARGAEGASISLKVKDKWFYYLMDKNNGQFHEPALFDHVVGLKRNLKAK